MHANDVELVRVYTREHPAGTILDQSFPDGKKVDIAVDCEAGTAIFGLGVPYELRVYVRDLMDNSEIDWKGKKSGDLGGAEWDDLAVTHEFTCPAPPLTKGNVYNVLAVLKVGAGKPIVSFAESPMFVIE